MKMMEKLLRKVNKVWNTLPKDVIALKVRPSNNLLCKEESVPISGLTGYYTNDFPVQTTSTVDNTVLWNGYPTIKTVLQANSGGGGVIINRNIPVEQGKKYTVSAFVKGTTNNETMSVKLTWYNKDGAWFVSEPIQSIPVSNTSFTRVVATGTPPAGAYFGRMKIQPSDVNRATTWWQAGFMIQQSDGATEFEFGSTTKRSKLTIDNSQLTFHDMQYQEGLPIKDSITLDDYTLDELLGELESLGYKGNITSEAGNYSSLKAFRLMEASNLDLKVPSRNILNAGTSSTSTLTGVGMSSTIAKTLESNIGYVTNTSVVATVNTSTITWKGIYWSSTKLNFSKAHSASCYVKNKIGTNLTVNLRIEWKNASNVILRSDISTDITLTDSWQRLTTPVSSPPPAGAVSAYICVYNADSKALNGDAWYINGLQLEEGSEVTEWISGDTYTPVELSIFTSQLWELLYPIARLLRNADNDTDKALEQLRLPNAQGKWLDYWASFFDIKRLSNESDRSFGKRIFGRLANMKTNNVAIEDLLSYTLDVDVKVNDSSASTFEVLVDPVYMDSLTYIRDLVNEVKGAGIDYFVNYFKNYSEDYKSYFKDRNGIEFADADVFSGGEIIFPIFEEANFMYDTSVGFTLNEDVLTGFGGYSNILSANYSDFESLVGTNITTSNGVATSLDSTEKVYGSNSLKAVANGLYTDQQVTLSEINVLPNTTYTFQFMVKGDVGKSLRYYLASVDNTYAVLAFHGTTVITLGDWTKCVMTFTTPANTVKIRLTTHTVGNSAQTWYLDGLQLQTGDSADEWILGGTTRNFTSEDLFGIRIQESVTMTFEETVSNLLSANQSSIETDTSGFFNVDGSSIITRDTSEAWHGLASLKVVTAGLVATEGIKTIGILASPSSSYAGQLRIKGSGTVRINLSCRDIADTFIANIDTKLVTLTNDWQLVTLTGVTTSDAKKTALAIITDGVPLAVTFWVDGLQIQKGNRAKTWVLGGTYGEATNLLTPNQSSVETDTNGFIQNSGITTLSRDTSEVWDGTASLKVVTGGSVVAEGMATNPHTPITIGQTYTASAYVKGSGTVHLEIAERDGAGAIITNGTTMGANVTLTNQWQRLEVTRLCSAGVYANLKVVTNTTQAITFWVDGLMIEPNSVASNWALGGTTKIYSTIQQQTL